jgi:hypothetical protein
MPRRTPHRKRFAMADLTVALLLGAAAFCLTEAGDRPHWSTHVRTRAEDPV